MKNNLTKIAYFIFLFFLIIGQSIANEQFNFDVTEIEITDNGNKFTGLNKGKITTDNGLIIEANTFEYDKKLNILKASGKVKIDDKIKELIIYSDQIIYLKNEEKIFTYKNSKAVNNQGIIIDANNFEFNKILNILNANGNVKIEDTKKDFIIYADDITYLRNQEKIFTQGKTEAIIESKYNFKSKNVVLLRNKMLLSSNDNTDIIDDKSQFFNLSKFIYSINDEKLKGDNVIVITNFNLPKSDKFYFSNGNFDLKNKSFTAKDTKIKLHKNIFDDNENDPRLYGASSTGNSNKTLINKAIFTSCKKNDTCPPWSIKSEKIIHDKKEKQLIYKNAILRIYDFPVLYFPKFFHPDPSVDRQTGFLKPQVNNSDNLGSSIKIPYYYVVSDNKDFTFYPNIYDDDKFTIQNEYRQRNKNYEFDADFSLTYNYFSPLLNKKKNFTHFFSNFTYDLNLPNFTTSKINSKIEKVNDKSYLKLFESVLQNSPLKPTNLNQLESNLTLQIYDSIKDFEAGINIYENLQIDSNDRFQYVLPYYSFYSDYYPKKIDYGYFTFSSDGNNNLVNTNNLKTKITNNLSFNSFNKISNFGFVNNINLHLKNLNVVAKNDSLYKSSPQLNLMSLLEVNSKIPMEKNTSLTNKSLTPRVSLKVNPQDMKDFSSTGRNIDINNIFGINRLGLNETLESGASLTLGLDYNIQSIANEDNYFNINMASVFRNKEENNIPKTTTLNRKNSNLFGLINFRKSLELDNSLQKKTLNKSYFDMKYDFAIDNDLSTFEYNSIDFGFGINNFVTKFKFIEKNGEMGEINSLENSLTYEFDENNLLTFNTRRNRKINLTEYYDLLYEYKNDCLTAGVKYKKTYYQDGDLKPTEDLMFTLTIIPLTTFEQEVDQSVYRN